MKLKRVFHIRNWPNQLILSNLQDGNSLKFTRSFQSYPLTLNAYKNLIMKPIPLFLKKNSHPPIRAIFEKSAPPF